MAPLLRRFGLSITPHFRWKCLTVRAVNRIPAPATSHVACGFPALRAPVHFTSKFMRPIRPERLPSSTADTKRGTPKKVRSFCTEVPCPIASSRSLDADTPEPDGAVSSSLPSLGYMRNTDSHGLWQSIHPTAQD